MDESTFLNEGGVTVTKSRFIVPSQTYAMSGITSVKNSQENPNRLYPIVVGVIGVAALSGGATTFGAIALILAVVWLIGQKTQYHVVLTTAGGETKALTSTNGEFTKKVIAALNDCIIARG
ncbi:MAG: DUF6232 family protein [Rhodospirillaceae bacterium]